MPSPRLCVKCAECGSWIETDRHTFEKSRGKNGWACKPCAIRTRNKANSRQDGSTRKKGRYIEEKRDGKWMFQHRVVAEKMLGRQLLPGEAVHHIDGNPLNNIPENLSVMRHGDHTAMHHTGLKRSKEACRNISKNRRAPHIPQKLSLISVLIIRDDTSRELSYSELARRYGVSKGCIAAVVKRRTWRHV